MIKGFLKIFILLAIFSVSCKVLENREMKAAQEPTARAACGSIKYYPELYKTPNEIMFHLSELSHELLSDNICTTIDDKETHLSTYCHDSGKVLQTCESGDVKLTFTAQVLDDGLFSFFPLLSWLFIAAGIIFMAIYTWTSRMCRHSISTLIEEMGGEKRKLSFADKFARWLVFHTGTSEAIEWSKLELKPDIDKFKEVLEEKASQLVSEKVRQKEKDIHNEMIKHLRHDIRACVPVFQMSLAPLRIARPESCDMQAQGIRNMNLILDKLDQVGKTIEKKRLVVVEVALESKLFHLSQQFQE